MEPEGEMVGNQAQFNIQTVSSVNFSSFSHLTIVPITNPKFLTVAPFEYINLPWWKQWFHSNWQLSVYFSLAYVIIIFGLQAFMQNRKPFQLRIPLAIWSATLAIFSIAATIRTLPELLDTLYKPNGLHRSICNREEHNMATAFWFLLMPLSKVVELGDTLFIVFRKQNLLFLHWYHHITVMMYCWRVYEYYAPVFNWFATINFFVHSVMYSYYTFKALKFNIPRNFAMLITILQIAQMVAGISLNVYTFSVKNNGGECERETNDLNLALSMYASYFVLFAKFFYEAYFAKNGNKTATANNNNNNNKILNGSSSSSAIDINNNAINAINANYNTIREKFNKYIIEPPVKLKSG